MWDVKCTLNVDNVNLDDFDYWCHKWFGSNVLNGDCSRTVYFRSLFRNEPDHHRSGEMLQIIEHLFLYEGNIITTSVYWDVDLPTLHLGS